MEYKHSGLFWNTGSVVTRSALSFMLFLDSAHLPAPIALAWANEGFRRRVVLEHKIKFIAVPLLVIAISVLTVPLTMVFWPEFHPLISTSVRVSTDGNLANPFTAVLTLFLFWNLYHFGAQNFGVWRLWRRGRGTRWLQKWTWTGGTIFGMVGIPVLIHVLAPVCVCLFGLAHWLVAIELAARASRHRVVFWSAMLVVGAALSAAIVIGVVYGGLVVAMLVVSARMGLGLIHFLYDRWVWRFSDPRVRATIGRDLLVSQSG